ncbi:hypothetical protein T05_5573 [Trichinella murrelli]|uniref:Uncharacterized protein n=1 Tax=Trichinella murrelli TaxID=144512 RepID=A0A0V0T0P9_9BILA|nr:hypothetical protein T05_5573 [Trichinella murrelli]
MRSVGDANMPTGSGLTRQTRYQRMMVTRSDRSFVCDARTPLYHTLAQVRFQPRQQRQNG